jgi:hypothetical protein
MKLELFTFECELLNKDEKNIDFVLLGLGNGNNFFGSLFSLSWNDVSGLNWDLFFINGIIRYFRFRAM